MNDHDIMKETLFELSEDALYVANGGHTFTREGVIGICASHLSEKKSNHSDDYECADKDLISEIRKSEVAVYEKKKSRLVEDANQEEEIRHDYDGRFAWELLQNADDVMGSTGRQPAELIGTKGLGFKSVLEITEEPEIHSDPFNFRFSPYETQRFLKREGLHNDPPRLTFRIPHSCEPTGKVCELLDVGYSTVVRLPFRDEVAQEKAKKVLKNLDPCFLLLSQQIETVRIIQDGVEQVFRIRRGTQGLSEGRVVLETPSSQKEWQRWVTTQDIDETKRLTVAVAIPLNEYGEAVPHTNELPLHVFFPTEEQSGVKALIHASYDLQQNRKHLRQGNYDDKILDHFGDLLKRLMLDIPAQTVLKVFGAIDQPEEDNGKPIEKIKKTIWEKMRTTPFVPVLGGERACPPDSKYWNDKLGQVLRGDEKEIQKAALVTPALSNFSDVLRKLGASEIEDHQFVHLLRYCRNESLDDCISSFHVLLESGLNRVQEDNDKETLSLLRQVPCWWTEDGEARQLDDMPPLLWEKPEDWLQWLALDTLHPEFRIEIEEWEGQCKEAHGHPQTSKIKKWENLIERFLSRKKEHYIDWVLLPFIKSWKQRDWERQGFDVLTWLMRWENQYEFEKTTPCIRDVERNEEDRRRIALAVTLRLPTNKGWMPAIDCFAGMVWDGPEAFDTFYQSRKGRGIVQSFEKWPDELKVIDKDKWKGLLRWTGVSWEPKVRRMPDFKIPVHQRWSGYYSKFDNVTLRGGHNYQIDDFPECFSGIGNVKLLRDIFPALSKLTGEHAQRKWKYPSGKVVYTSSPKAFIFEQLCKEAWLPINKSLLESSSPIPPNKAFLPGKGLNGLLPEVDKSDIDEDIWHGRDGIKARLIELGVMENLPESSEKWYEWMQKLADKGRTLDKKDREVPADWKDGGSKDLWRVARSLYREYLKKRISGTFPKDIQIPCICLNRILDFAQPEEVHWIDESHLTDLTLENKLLSKGYKLFIFRLQQSDEMSQLGVRKLSGVIECKAVYKELSGNQTHELYERYGSRRIVLNKVMKIQLPDKVAIKAVTDLTLKLSTNGEELGNCSVLSWKEGEKGHILVDTKNKWRSLAHALAHRLDGQYTKHVNDFEVYLSDDNDISVLARARDAGIPEEALQEVENSFSSLPETEPPVEKEEVGGEATEDMGNGSPTYSYRHDDATSQTTVSGNSGTAETGIISDSRDKPKKAREHSANDEGRKSDPRPETGLDAEKWLENRLLEIWPEEVKKVHEGRDFTISFDGKTIHIEAKHVETRPGSIHWSQRQYDRCKKEKPNYFIALLSPGENDNNQYAIHWIWNPLERLKKLNRKVTWSGKSNPMSLLEDSWEIESTNPKTLDAKNFDIEIALAADAFDSDNQDDANLEKLKGKLNTDG